jgi:hypothetical protein
MIDLTKIKPAKVVRPPRIFIYGEPKVGKSTFCSQAPNPLFLDIEGGLDAIETNHVRINSLQEFDEALDAVLNQEHGFNTLVIDSVDWLEKLIHTDICEKAKASSITDKRNQTTAYGNGYIMAQNAMRAYLAKLDAIRDAKGMAILMIGHSMVRKMEQPDSEAYDSFVVKMHDKATAAVQEWCDVMAFARLKTMTNSDGKASAGKRVLVMADTKYAVVGNRYNLPKEISLDWDEFSKSFSEATK